MQTIFLSGRAGGNAETREAGGTSVTSFNVAVDQGWGDKKSTNWYRCSIWGDRGSKLREHIRKGDKVALTGELSVEDYQGKMQLNVRVSEIDPFMAPKGESIPRTNETAGYAPPNSNAMMDMDSDVPF